MNKTISIASVLPIALRNYIRLCGKFYMVSDVVYHEDPKSYIVFLSDPNADIRVPIVWTESDEERCDTDEKVEAMVEALIVNAFDSLEFLLSDEHRETVTNMYDGLTEKRKNNNC